MEKILIVDDEENILHSFNRVLSDKGYEVFTARSGAEAIQFASDNEVNLVLMDINMPEMGGMEAFQKIKAVSPKVPIIMMTGFGSTEATIETMRMGAYDYITKPFDMNEIQMLIDKSLLQSKLTQTVNIGNQQNDGEIFVNTQAIVGKSAVMQDLYKLIGKVAGSNIPVLIQGESGTGKELVARAVYQYSDRKDKPFIAVNCAAIPETLLESELFGHEKGAFTGANDRRIGRFEQCNGGTLFLDEIGDMPLVIQAKLLRVLQSGEIERLGSNETIKVDVRIISATNKDLETAILGNQFREDLYYRLNVVTLHVPPLRDRKDDVPVLIDYFINKFNFELKKQVSKVPKSVQNKLLEYYWPGNVRELENVIKRAVVLTKDSNIKEEDIVLKDHISPVTIIEQNLPTDFAITGDDLDLFSIIERHCEPLFNAVMNVPRGERKDILPILEEILLKKTLIALKGNQVQSSRLLGITRNTLRKRIIEFQIS